VTFLMRWSRLGCSIAGRMVIATRLRPTFSWIEPSRLTSAASSRWRTPGCTVLGSLTDGLRTGELQNEAKGGGEDLFDVLYEEPERLRGFLAAMTGISTGAASRSHTTFLDRYQTFCDSVPPRAVPVQVALQHPQLTGIGFDLPQVGPIFEDYVASFGLRDRVRFAGGDFFADPLPENGCDRDGPHPP